jgi:hypothetical protein
MKRALSPLFRAAVSYRRRWPPLGSLAIREFAVRVEDLECFVVYELLRRVHESVFEVAQF